jgi:hypothetical protein
MLATARALASNSACQQQRLPATALASNTDFPVGYPSVVVQTNFATITNASRDESELFAADQKFCG